MAHILRKLKMWPVPIGSGYCACGCGEMAKPGNKVIKGHRVPSRVIECPICNAWMQPPVGRARICCSKQCDTKARRRAAVTRFWTRVVKQDDGCWIYTGPAQSNGYGAVGLSGRERAHRFAWELSHGEPPPADMQVCHKCDVRRCVNPDHLFLGTGADNMQDCIAKGRFHGGRRSTLTPEQRADRRRESQRKANLKFRAKQKAHADEEIIIHGDKDKLRFRL